MDPLAFLRTQLPEIEEKLGYAFQEPERLLLAFVHRSFHNEHREIAPESNERLEFLGDSVLGMAIAEWLYTTQPQCDEGALSQMRSRLVDAPACASYLHHLGLSVYVLLGKGEMRNQGRGRGTIYADLFEALVGALYLDGGIEPVRVLLRKQCADALCALAANPPRNWKAELQDWVQKKWHVLPVYQVLAESGPDHGKLFEVVVSAGTEELGRGQGSSKKEAEQAAAHAALATRGGSL